MAIQGGGEAKVSAISPERPSPAGGLNCPEQRHQRRHFQRPECGDSGRWMPPTIGTTEPR